MEPQFQRYKCHVVLRGDILKDDSGSYAVFTEQGSSASRMTAVKVMDIISRLPGCSGKAADAVSASTQVKMEDAPRKLKIPKSECPDVWIRLSRHKWPEETRRRLIHNMSRICNRVEEEHMWMSECHRAVQEQKILEHSQYDIEAPCVWPWRVLWFAAPTKENENIRSAGAARDRMEQNKKNTLCSSLWNLSSRHNRIQEAVVFAPSRAWISKGVTMLSSTECKWTGGKMGAVLLWVKLPVVTSETDAV